MSPSADTLASQAPGEPLIIRRTFAAPRDLVFEAWTRPEHLVQWFGPRDFTLPFHDFDVRAGRPYRCCMRSPEGKDHWLTGRWLTIDHPHRLVFTFQWDDDEGEPGLETTVTCTFEEVEPRRTLLTLHQQPFRTDASREGHRGGWSEALDRLAALVATSQEH